MALGARASRGLIAGALLVATVAVYAPVLDHEFLAYDDDVYVTARPEVVAGLGAEGVAWAFRSFQGANWFPLTRLSWMLDAELHGLDAGGFLATNVALHALASLLLFFALQRMTGASGRSAFVAGVFALHPLHVESVAWVAARKDTLSGVFFAATLFLYARSGAGPRSPARMAAVSACFAAGLMAKQTLVTLPFVLLLLDYWPLRRIGAVASGSARDGAALRAALLEKLPLFALAAVASGVTVLAQGSAGVISDLGRLPFSYRLANAAVALCGYLRRAFVPTDLAVFYPHPGRDLDGALVLGAGVLLAGITLAALGLARRVPALAVGWLWFVGMLVPVLGLVQVGDQALADRYSYLPLIGLAIAVAWGAPVLLRSVPRAPVLSGALAAAVLLALVPIARAQVNTWRDTETLMRHALGATGENYVAHAYLGAALLARGRSADGLQHWRDSARIAPGYATVANNLAWLLATHPNPATRDGAEAVRHAERAHRLAGEAPAVLDTLAAAYAADGRFGEARRTAERAAAAARAAGDDALVAGIERRLARYRIGRAWLEHRP